MSEQEDANKFWEGLNSFERFPKLNDELKKEGSTAKVTFLDEGKEIKADVISSVLKNKGVKGIKAKDSRVFTVEKDNVKYELWVGCTSFTNLRELADIRKKHGNTLIGAKVKATRISENDPEKPSMSFEPA